MTAAENAERCLRGLSSAASHDVSYDSLFTALEFNALPAVSYAAPAAALMYAAPALVTYAAPAHVVIYRRTQVVDYLMVCTRSRNGSESLI